MATVINNPSSDTGGDAGVVLGILAAIIIIALLLLYGLPALRNASPGGTNINVPDKVDINVSNPSGGSNQ